jgi:5-methylcytosine-specific restriction endonuclease McrA
METRTLILNSWYAPVRTVSWQDAAVLLYLGKIEILSEYDEVVSSPSVSFKIPAVARLKHFKKSVRRGVKFSRGNVFARDKFTCAYCSVRGTRKTLNFEHVMPRSRGGRTCWENIVTSCRPCNTAKRNRTPEEAGMRLLTKPRRPDEVILAAADSDGSPIPDLWEPWLQKAA